MAWSSAYHSCVECCHQYVGPGLWLGGSNEGMTKIGSVQGPRFRFRSIPRGLAKGQAPALFSERTEMRAQAYVLGDLTRAIPGLIPCTE